jgi:SAM-dependent methyltransferase
MAMTPPPHLTDRQALIAHRNRANKQAGLSAAFLQCEARDEIEERLEEVNRPFTKPAIVTGWPEIWADGWVNAKIIPDDDTLALEPASHDLIIHAMALHWANDPVGQLIQCRRALRPDGLFLSVLFGGQTLHELRACLAEAEIAVTGGLSLRIAPMAEIRDLGALLQRAGFALPVADNRSVDVSYRSSQHLMRDLRAMGETNALTNRRRHLTRRSVFTELDRLYRHRFGQTDGTIRATFDLIFLAGWAPDAGQQQPLRPGSATARLADALNTDETAL